MAKAYQHQANPRSHLLAVHFSCPGVFQLPGWLVNKRVLSVDSYKEFTRIRLTASSTWSLAVFIASVEFPDPGICVSSSWISGSVMFSVLHAPK
jgi:hypothetical protein